MSTPRKLRPATQLTAERRARDTRADNAGHDAGMKQVIESIESAHAAHKTSVWGLTLPDSVVKELKAKGYRVKYHRACGMGDMDSHEITWD